MVNGFTLDIAIGQNSVTLHGTVRDYAGNPLSGVVVAVFVMDQEQPIQATTGQDGTYSIELQVDLSYEEVALVSGIPQDCVPPSPVDLEIRAGPVLLLDGQPSDGTLDWNLQQAYALLTGQLNLDGTPLEALLIILVDGQEVGESWAAGGTYELPLPPGNVRVVLEVEPAPGNAVWPAPFSATIDPQNPPQGPITYDFIFSSQASGKTVSGQVTTAQGPFETDLDLYVSQDNGVTWDIYGYLFTAQDGTYQLMLPAGLYRLEIPPEDIPEGQRVVSPTTFVVTDQGVFYEDGSELQSDPQGIYLFNIQIQ